MITEQGKQYDKMDNTGFQNLQCDSHTTPCLKGRNKANLRGCVGPNNIGLGPFWKVCQLPNQLIFRKLELHDLRKESFLILKGMVRAGPIIKP